MSSTTDRGGRAIARPMIDADAMSTTSPVEAPKESHDEPIADVLDRCQEDDRDAKQLLYLRYSELVYALVFRIVGQQDASDVAQQVFLQVFRKLHQFRGQSDFQTWLYRLAVNEALQHQRKSKRRTLLPLLADPIDSNPAHRRTEHKELLEQALAAIPADLRTIFVLREVEHLSYQQIAEVLNISEGTVASRLNRTRRELRSVITRLGWEVA